MLANSKCSPVPVCGAVQQQQQGDPRHSGQDGAHPETELTEVTVLDDGQDGGAAQEHGHLGRRSQSFRCLTEQIESEKQNIQNPI